VSAKIERQFCLPHVCLLMFLLLATAPARGQSAPPSFGDDVLSCAPAPCVLPPTRASEGGHQVTDTPIVVDPLDPKKLLMGSLDRNCTSPPLGFHVSTDGGSTWTRTTCMGNIIAQQRVYYPMGQPMVGYDLSGEAYIGGSTVTAGAPIMDWLSFRNPMMDSIGASHSLFLVGYLGFIFTPG
jgi:hypothetical protein